MILDRSDNTRPATIDGRKLTETATDILRKSFSAGVKFIEDWKLRKGETLNWGNYKDSYIGHLLRQKALNIPVRSSGGGTAVVNAHTQTHGPSWRMIVSMEKTGVKAIGVYPGGQSGNPGSPFYANMVEPWAKAKYYTLHFVTSPDQLSGKKVSSTQLSPAQ